jgi:hypothetical protein
MALRVRCALARVRKREPCNEANEVVAAWLSDLRQRGTLRQ